MVLTLLVVSSLVSLATLGALLFHRRRAESLAIPTWFLGKKELNWRALERRRPPWVTWALVGLFTLSGALLYAPWPPPQAPGSRAQTLVWWDRSLPSFGAWAALTPGQKQDIATSLWHVLAGGAHLLLEDVEPGWAQVPGPRVSYTTQALGGPGDMVARFDALLSRGPWPWPQPLHVPHLRHFLGSPPLGSTSEVFVVSVPGSGALPQWDSLVGADVISWHPLYLPLPPPPPATAVAPASLLAAWGVNGSGAVPPDSWVPVPGNRAPPEQALPPVGRSNLGSSTSPSPLSWVHYGPRRRALGPGGRAPFPILFRCDTTAGPGELDPGADLQALAHFFSIPTFPCPPTAAEEGTGPLWAFRGPGVVVRPWPASGALPAPSKTESHGDTTVWVPPPEALATAPVVAVPLDPGHGPTLMPLPPFPEGLPQGTTPLWQAGPPLALALPRGDVVLRTPLALPGAPLGRSPTWTSFWLKLATNGSGDSSSLQVYRPLSPQDPWPSGLDLAQWVGASGEVETLPGQPVPGLYKLATGPWLLWEGAPPLGGGSPSASPTPRLTTGPRSPAPTATAPGPGTTPWPQWVALLGALGSLGLLWARWPRREWFVVLITLGAWRDPTAWAQGGAFPFFFKNFAPSRAPRMPRPATLGVKVGWCGTEVPQQVAARWQTLGKRLAELGTIDLPPALIADGCRLGKSQVWWSPTPGALPWDLLGAHTRLGGAFVVESFAPALLKSPPWSLVPNPSLGKTWEYPYRRGPLLRSFFLMSSFDGCQEPSTAVLVVRRGVTVDSPLGIATGGRLLASGGGCGPWDDLLLEEAFTNLWYFLLTTNYKQEQMQLPELLNRVRNLGLEP